MREPYFAKLQGKDTSQRLVKFGRGHHLHDIAPIKHIVEYFGGKCEIVWPAYIHDRLYVHSSRARGARVVQTRDGHGWST